MSLHYTDEEVKKLSDEEFEAYCQNLEDRPDRADDLEKAKAARGSKRAASKKEDE